MAAPATGQQAQSELSLSEEQWLETRGRTFRVAAELDHPPYAFVDADDQYKGLVADYLEILGERLGVTFTYQRYDTFEDMLAAVRQREIDLLPLLSESEERREYLLFTTPIAVANDRIVLRQGGDPNMTLDDLRGRRLGTVAGYATLDDVRQQYPEIRIAKFINERAALHALSQGEIDAVVADGGVASYAIQQEGITNLVIGGELDIYAFQRIGVRSDWPELRDILNKGLASISADERLRLERRWVNIESASVLVGRTQLLVLLLILLSMALGVFAWIYSLRRLVARRTRKLHEELEERRQIEAANSRLVAAIEQAGELVLLLKPDGAIEYVNLSFIQALGEHPGDRGFASLGHGDAEGELTAALEQVADTRQRWSAAVELRTTNDATLKVALTIAPLLEHGELRGFVVTGQDVTASSEMAARLQQAEKLSAIGTLAGGIAHDFNNLLVPILGSAELLRMDADESAYSLIDAITASAERSRQLVQSIVAFSREGSIKRQPLNLRSEIASGIEYLRSILPGNIAIRESLKCDATVLGNAAQIQQILLNLATNATEAMQGKTGVLSITLRSCIAGECTDKVDAPADATCCELVVTDNGAGIAPEDIGRIFDPYYTKKVTGKGTGLGLATVYRIVTDHGGTIRAESTPGQGTTFRILFPTIDETVVAADSPPVAQPASDTTARPVMLVDDDPVALDTLSKLLQVGGHATETFQKPAEALAAVRNAPDAWHFLISDQSMPGMLGTQLLDAVSEINPRLPVMLLSGQVEQIDSAYPALGKPIRLAELMHEMERIRRETEASLGSA